MKRSIALRLGLVLAILWLGCAWWLAPWLEHQLQQSAQQQINSMPTGYGPLQVRASGRELILSGKVRHRDQVENILRVLRHDLRVGNRLASRFNPVASVLDRTELSPYPNGWLMITAAGARGQLWGACAHETEARDLRATITQAWTERGGYLDSHLLATPTQHDEAQAIEATLDQLPLPSDKDPLRAQAAVAVLGGPWHTLPLNQPEALSQKRCLEAGMQPSTWEKFIAPALAQLRRHHQEQLALAAERERQSRLPPAHLFLAWRDKRLLLRGEVADLAGKRQWLNALIETFPQIRIIDDVRVNPERRREINLPAITVADLAIKPPQLADDPPEGRGVLLGIAGGSWQRLGNLRLGTPNWASSLPKPLQASMLLADHRMVTQWVLDDQPGIPSLEPMLQPSFILLTLLPERVWISGQVAEVSARSQILESLKRAYGGRVIIDAEEFIARGNCQPSPELLDTLHSLPTLPRPGQRGHLAFALPGQSLRSAALQAPWLEPGYLQQSGLIPVGFPAALAEYALLAQLPWLRRHLAEPGQQAKSLPKQSPP